MAQNKARYLRPIPMALQQELLVTLRSLPLQQRHLASGPGAVDGRLLLGITMDASGAPGLRLFLYFQFGSPAIHGPLFFCLTGLPNFFFLQVVATSMRLTSTSMRLALGQLPVVAY